MSLCNEAFIWSGEGREEPFGGEGRWREGKEMERYVCMHVGRHLDRQQRRGRVEDGDREGKEGRKEGREGRVRDL